MNKKILEQEMHFLLQLKVLATHVLLESSLKDPKFPKGFDIAKAIKTLERAIESEIDFLEREPDDYLEIYGSDD